MDVTATTEAALATAADAVAVFAIEGEQIHHDAEGGPLARLLASGEGSGAARRVASTHCPDGRRLLLVGLGRREALDAEAARVGAALALIRAREMRARSLVLEVPHKVDETVVRGLVEGAVLAGFEIDELKAERPEDRPRIEQLLVSAHEDVSTPVSVARVMAQGTNAARRLANLPANELTPVALADRARRICDQVEGLSIDVMGREQIEAAGMGAFAAVAAGSDAEPQCITLRYSGLGRGGTQPLLGFVGKAVTFDSGGISIKPAAKMQEMKFDMSGGAAVVEAMSTIAKLRLPVRVVAVVGATENLQSRSPMRPGDVVRTKSGLTVEVNNTDAEGRLVLADCLALCSEQGAERLVDVATLTGAIVTALGSTHCGLFATDDDWAQRVAAAGAAAGEPTWRLPLHPDYAELVKGRYGDLLNATEHRKAASITAAEFLRRFAGDIPWVHLDIAGTAWDTGKPYAKVGGSGWGVRTLVELARAHAAA